MYRSTMIPEDEYRKKVGWKGEWELFRAAQATHSVKHPTIDSSCKLCEVIQRNLTKLQVEVEELIKGG